MGLGHTKNNFSDVGNPIRITFFDNIPVRDITGGEHHSVVISENGEVYSFGRNSGGELGLGKNI